MVGLPEHLLTAPDADRPGGRPSRAQLLGLALVVLAGAALRFSNLQWGAPYYHFHIDEHFVFSGADLLARSPREAALSPKFFMYSPLPMYMLIAVRWIYQAFAGPLVLSVPGDAVTFTVLGRAISATLGTATILVVWGIGRHVSGPRAGLIGAAFAACGVLHLRESHFFTVDIPLTFFSLLTLWLLLRAIDRFRWTTDVLVGVGLGAALLCKYTAVFLVPVIGVAYLLPAAPASASAAGWTMRALRACVAGLVGGVLFLASNPLVLLYYAKFRQDIADWVTAPLTGQWKPIWTAQFADIASPHLFWFTNVLWWGLGPAFEVLALAGVVWLFWSWRRPAMVVGTFIVAYYLIAAQTVTPFARYGVPLVPALAAAAGALASDLLARSRWRLATRGVIALTLLSTALYAVAYDHVFRAPDSRLSASKYLLTRVPSGSRVLVEPSQNMVPMGSYLTAPNFYRDYMLRGSQAARDDYYQILSLDTYEYLYDRRHSPEDKARYISARLTNADYIVMDDTFLQFYRHLPAEAHGVVQKYYDDLFAGRLGFELMRSFKVYPSIFGMAINDDDAELTFRLFDHPRVFVFRRTAQSRG